MESQDQLEYYNQKYLGKKEELKLPKFRET